MENFNKKGQEAEVVDTEVVELRVRDIGQGYEAITRNGCLAGLSSGDRRVVLSPEWDDDVILNALEGFGEIPPAVRGIVGGMLRASREQQEGPVSRVDNSDRGRMTTGESNARVAMMDVMVDRARSEVDAGQIVSNVTLMFEIMQKGDRRLFEDCSTPKQMMNRAMEIVDNANKIALSSEKNDTARRMDHLMQDMMNRIASSPLKRNFMSKRIREAADLVAVAAGQITASQALRGTTEEDIEVIKALNESVLENEHNQRALKVQVKEEESMSSLRVHNQEATLTAERRRARAEASLDNITEFFKNLADVSLGSSGFVGKANDAVLGADGVVQRFFDLFQNTSLSAFIGDMSPGVILGAAVGIAAAQTGLISVYSPKELLVIFTAVGAVSSYGFVNMIRKGRERGGVRGGGRGTN